MRYRPLVKQLVAASMTISLTIGSIGMFPAAAYADSKDMDTYDTSGEGTQSGDTATAAFKARDIEEEIAELLARGDYEEGRAIVLYDTQSPASDEELVGAGSLLGSAEQIAEVSAESYVNATGETLELSKEELVGAASDEGEDRIAVLAVEDRSRSTEEIHLWLEDALQGRQKGGTSV